MSQGISVVICCHNSVKRLGNTLEHILSQEVSAHIPWEILLIDNASTDDTANFALSYFRHKNLRSVSYRIIREERLGLSHARRRGFQEARFDILSFIDDDNWVSPKWVENVYQIMVKHPEVGACGGRTEAVFETPPPGWFERHQSKFAIGNQGLQSGDITDTRGYLWGAGLNVRKEAWNFLERNGFDFYLTDRKGSILLSGGDSELCFALRLSGWKLWYEDALFLRHYIPSNRLTWKYLRKLVYGFGVSSAYLSAYRIVLRRKNLEGLVGRSRMLWLYYVRTLIEKLMINRKKWYLSRHQPYEGDDEVLELDYLTGRLSGFLKQRNHFDSKIYALARARWNILNQSEITDALPNFD